MLKKVRIKNFLSCEDTEFDLEQMTVLIGRNAAGKSNILKTIQEIALFILGNDSFSILPNKQFEFNILIGNDDLKYYFNTSSEYIISEEFLYCGEVIAKRIGEKAYYFEKEFHANNLKSIVSLIITFFPESEVKLPIKEFFKFCKEINYYTLEPLKNEMAGFESDYYEKWLSKKTDSSVMRLLHLWNEDKETFNELQEILGKNGLEVVNEINIRHIENFYFIHFAVKNSEVHYGQLSYGTQRVLMILLAILYDKSKVLLIEQPEDGIHIGLLRKVLSICFTYAKAYNKQLIITTHSPEVIDMVKPENIRFVRITENGTKVSALDKERLPFFYDYIRNEGALSDLIESMDDE